MDFQIIRVFNRESKMRVVSCDKSVLYHLKSMYRWNRFKCRINCLIYNIESPINEDENSSEKVKRQLKNFFLIAV